MEKQIITFSANEQRLIKTGGIECYASNIVSYIEAHFDLGANWSGYDSVRAVWSNDNNMTTISTVLDADGVCIVPFEVLKTKGIVKVNLVGSISVSGVLTDRLTTFPCEAVKVTAKAKIEGSETQPITPSQFEQFVEAVKEDADRAEQGAESAEQSAQNAETSADNALLYSQNSEASAIRASGYALDAQGYAQNAEISAQNAETAKDEAEDARDEIRNMSANATTLPAGSDATASYSDGVLSLGIPQGIQGEKGDNGETGATPSFSIGTVETLEPTESATATITGTDENPVLNLGLPKGEQGEVSMSQLDEATIVQTLSDNEPYHFRATPKCGSRQLDTIVGGSVGWNQLSPIITDYSAYLGTKSVSDNVLTFTATASTASGAQVYKSVGTPLPANHKYLSLVQIRPSKAVGIKLSYYSPNARFVPSKVMTANAWNLYSGIVATVADTVQLTFYTNVDSALSEGDTVEYKNFMVIDLTLMLGSTIADYVYSLEQSTAGSGVAWLKRYFDLDSYHPYDSGSIQSVSGLVSHDCVGFNAWDEEWEVGGIRTADGTTVSSNAVRSKNFNKIIGDSGYYVKAPNDVYVFFYDANYGYITYTALHNNVFTSPTSASYFKIQVSSAYGTTYNHDICINISSDRNGTYEPYAKQSYPLDNSVVLHRGFGDAELELYQR